MKAFLLFLVLVFLSSFPVVAAKDIDCFSRYHFSDSYFRAFWTDRTAYNAGDNVTINVQLQNTNDYPMPELNLRAYVSYVGKTFADRPEGNDMVDEFWIARDVNLLPGNISNHSFVWSIPRDAESGVYLVSLYLNSVDQFNLGGLSFYPEIAGKILVFEVNNSGGGSRIYFDKNSVHVGNQQYHFRAPSGSYTLPQTVTASLTNDGPPTSISVSYRTYAWDDSSESNLVKVDSESIAMAKGQTKQVYYTIPSLPPNVYQLVLTAQSTDGRKSILKVRLPMDTENGRFIYLGLDKFPITKNSTVNVFWCFSNSAYSSYTGKQTIEVRDSSGRSVAEFDLQNVNITGGVSGQENPFSSPQDLRNVTLIGRIYDSNGMLQKEVVIVYDAEKFGLKQQSGSSSFAYILLIPIIIVALAVAFVISRRRRTL